MQLFKRSFSNLELSRRRFDSPELGDPALSKRISRRAVLGGVAVGVGGTCRQRRGCPWLCPEVSSLASARDFGCGRRWRGERYGRPPVMVDAYRLQHKRGWLPNGNYKIDTLIAPPGYGWSIIGESHGFAILKQFRTTSRYSSLALRKAARTAIPSIALTSPTRLSNPHRM